MHIASLVSFLNKRCHLRVRNETACCARPARHARGRRVFSSMGERAVQRVHGIGLGGVREEGCARWAARVLLHRRASSAAGTWHSARRTRAPARPGAATTPALRGPAAPAARPRGPGGTRPRAPCPPSPRCSPAAPARAGRTQYQTSQPLALQFVSVLAFGHTQVVSERG